MKIIGFTGAGGTGKTTTAEQFGHNIPSLVSYLRKQAYGEDSSYGDLTKFRDILDFQNRILFAQIAEEELTRYNHKNEDIRFYVERSTIDYAAYMLNLSSGFIRNQNNFKAVQNYVNYCVSYANNNYSGIVYFPLDKFMALDDTEDKSKEREIISRKKTDTYISGLLDRLTIPVLKLESIDLDKRIKEINKFCQKIK